MIGGQSDEAVLSGTSSLWSRIFIYATYSTQSTRRELREADQLTSHYPMLFAGKSLRSSGSGHYYWQLVFPSLPKTS